LLFIIIDLHGGAGVFCRTLATGLRRHFGDEFDPMLLTLRAPAALPTDSTVFCDIRSLGTHVDNSWRKPAQLAAHLPALARAIREMHPARIITAGTYPNLLVPCVAPDVPTLLTVHVNTTQLLRDSRFRTVLRPLVRLRYETAPVVAPANGVADDLRRNHGAANVRVIHHGVDEARIRELAQATPENLPSAPYVIAVGRLTPQKDYPTLLRAYAAARERGLPHRLVIVGDGDLRDELTGLAREMELGQHVLFLGHRDNPYPYIRRADCLVLSSVFEGFGLVLAEAMALGVPVVSTDCPSGPAEILDAGQAGLLVPMRDVDALANALLRMTRPAERAQYASLAHRRAEAFTLERMAAEYRQALLGLRPSP
jgi:glycosyltransferase involved in cell wall biosynthesis